MPFALAGWESPDSRLEWTLACLLGVFGGLGHYLLALAHRYAPVEVLAPFVYQQVIYMALIGYLVFGDVPDPAVWIGAAIVIGSGLYLFSRGSAERGDRLRTWRGLRSRGTAAGSLVARGARGLGRLRARADAGAALVVMRRADQVVLDEVRHAPAHRRAPVPAHAPPGR